LPLILFNLYREYLTNKVPESFGDFKEGQVICTVKYADDLVLLAKVEAVLQGWIERLIEIGRCCKMEMNVQKTKVVRNSRHPSPVQTMKVQKQLENVEYFNCLGSMITNDAQGTQEIKSRIAKAKASFNKKKTFHQQIGLNLRMKLVKHYIWNIALYGVETQTLRKVGQKYLGSSEMWCWRRMEKISCIDHVGTEELTELVTSCVGTSFQNV